MGNLVRAILALVLAFIGGCGEKVAVKSMRISDTELNQGVTYSMPMQLAKLSAKRTPVPNDLKKAVSQVKEKLKDLTKTYVSQQESIKKVSQQIANLGQGPYTEAQSRLKRKLEKRRNALRESAAKTSDQLEATQATLKELEQIQERAANEKAEQGFIFEFKLEIEPPIPDPDRSYVADLQIFNTRDRQWTIETSESGLLHSSNAESTGREADILVELVKFGAALAPSATVGAFSAARKDGPSKTPPIEICQPPSGDEVLYKRPYELELKFDPSEEMAVDNTNCAMWRSGFPFQLVVQKKQFRYQEIWEVNSGTCPRNGNSPKGCNTADESETPESGEGLFYPRPEPYLIMVNKVLGWDGNEIVSVPAHSMVTVLPNKADAILLPIKDRSFVQVTNEVTFENGMLTKWNTVQPAGAYEFARLPYRLVKGAFSAVAELIQLKFDYSSKEQAIAEAKSAQIVAQQELKLIQACLETAADAQTAMEACFPD